MVLCTGYLAEQIAALFGDSYRGLRLGYSREAAPLGTGGAIRLALSQTAIGSRAGSEWRLLL